VSKGSAGPARHAHITWLGHSTVLVELDGTRLLTDPVLRDRVAHLRRTKPADAGMLYALDGILVSHLHYDHLDFPSLERLGRSVPVVVPRGAGRLLRRRRFEQIVEVETGEEVRIGGLVVRATHAEHEGGRGFLGTEVGALGYLIRGSHQIYFAGDTDLFEGMATLAPDLNIALVPIWGWVLRSALDASIRAAPPRPSASSVRASLSRSTGEPTRRSASDVCRRAARCLAHFHRRSTQRIRARTTVAIRHALRSSPLRQ
jgi:L-ascorbate metabolism protein UlaG (beta-lactamase superfamily)